MGKTKEKTSAIRANTFGLALLNALVSKGVERFSRDPAVRNPAFIAAYQSAAAHPDFAGDRRMRLLGEVADPAMTAGFVDGVIDMLYEKQRFYITGPLAADHLIPREPNADEALIDLGTLGNVEMWLQAADAFIAKIQEVGGISAIGFRASAPTEQHSTA